MALPTPCDWIDARVCVQAAARTARLSNLQHALRAKDRDVARAREEARAGCAAERERAQVRGCVALLGLAGGGMGVGLGRRVGLLLCVVGEKSRVVLGGWVEQPFGGLPDGEQPFGELLDGGAAIWGASRWGGAVWGLLDGEQPFGGLPDGEEPFGGLPDGEEPFGELLDGEQPFSTGC
eukprot:280747-Chlamydomonas_euryale.AAC.1